ncbi:lysylphosphatidylglycerol synthase transmembrane domain-containing protein [Amycolatopsis alkalitolerans]|uniref:Flippase-like domain-containing protein n=1 Tax=Amycolatopsis alkalitolerans TaxID=2547244 RepID=A0A5C4M4D4_9PSEU|nr:lysylphosphatidylglycerol synthase transmembrane domain-containing protein [Amycolatopsis alkalitolerans]TNC27429.1 flippase-like domain-containing protein [Amycolatopsis alkalitolerans]
MKTRILDVARWAALVLVIGFAVRELAANWTEFWRTLRGIAWESSGLSLLALVASIAVSTYGWQVVVNGLGAPVGYRRGARICLVGQLGKYVPGSVWAYLLQMELGRKAGLSRARVFTGSLVQFGIGLVAALPLAVLAGPRTWLLATIPAAAVLHPKVLSWGASRVLKLARRPPMERELTGRRTVTAFGAALVAWCLQGVHLWLLAGSDLLTCVGAMALAMTAGTFAFLLPSGAGVREAVLVAVLTAAGIPAGQALAYALTSRVMFTVADLLTALAAAGTPWRPRSGRPLAGMAARPG